jgi:hypothetical protein
MTNKRSNSVDSTVQRKRDELVKQVIMMGFNADIVEYAARKVDYTGVEQVIGYLTDRDDNSNLLLHDFVNFNDGKCFLCQQDAT